MSSSMGRILPFIMENKTCLKPPTRYSYHICQYCKWPMFNIVIVNYSYIYISYSYSPKNSSQLSQLDNLLRYSCESEFSSLAVLFSLKAYHPQLTPDVADFHWGLKGNHGKFRHSGDYLVFMDIYGTYCTLFLNGHLLKMNKSLGLVSKGKHSNWTLQWL